MQILNQFTYKKTKTNAAQVKKLFIATLYAINMCRAQYIQAKIFQPYPNQTQTYKIKSIYYKHLKNTLEFYLIQNGIERFFYE